MEATAFERKAKQLSERQLRMLSLIANGYSQKETADLVGITRDGVKKALEAVQLKLNTMNTPHSIYIVTKLGYI